MRCYRRKLRLLTSRKHVVHKKLYYNNEKFEEFCVFGTEKTSLEKKDTKSIQVVLEACDKTLSRATEQKNWAGSFESQNY